MNVILGNLIFILLCIVLTFLFWLIGNMMARYYDQKREFSDNEKDLLERLRILRQYVNALNSYYFLKLISKTKYDEEMALIDREVTKIEKRI